jgi:hypothetical protein
MLYLANQNTFSALCVLDERRIDALNDNASQLGISANAFFSGHNSRELTLLEYQSLKYASNKAVNTITLQAMVTYNLFIFNLKYYEH